MADASRLNLHSSLGWGLDPPVGNCNWERAKPNCPRTQRSAQANYSVISNQSKMRGETGEYLNCCSEI